jgi:hypothetical protein
MRQWLSAHEFDRDIRNAVADTEDEIFRESVGADERDYDAQGFLDEQSEAEGWDGDALGIEEVAHRNLHGDTSTNYDRPIEMQDQLTMAAEVEQLRRELAEEKKLVDDFVREPLVMQQREQVRENMRRHFENRYGLMDFGTDNSKLDLLITDLAAAAQQTEQLRNSRVNASLEYAAQKYGRDFDDAYNDLTATDPQNPLARQIVQHVYESADPGETLMQLHGNSLVRSLGMRNPPFFSQSHPRVVERAPQGRGSSGGFDSGWGDRDIEQSIFDAATWND